MDCFAFDFGNTQIKWGLFRNNSLASKGFLDYDEREFKSLLDSFTGHLPAVYSQVSGRKNFVEAIHSKFQKTVLEANFRLKLPFENKYETPHTLGVDRLAAIAGSVDLFSGCDKIIIDAGSCITYDFLTAKNTYEGGIIAPGLNMRLKAMNHFTDKLPDIKWNENENIDFLGKSTEGCILSGAVNGLLAEINGHIATLGQKDSLQVILTGGQALYLAKRLENSTFAAPNLVLIGLHKILTLNAQTS